MNTKQRTQLEWALSSLCYFQLTNAFELILNIGILQDNLVGNVVLLTLYCLVEGLSRAGQSLITAKYVNVMVLYNLSFKVRENLW